MNMKRSTPKPTTAPAPEGKTPAAALSGDLLAEFAPGLRGAAKPAASGAAAVKRTPEVPVEQKAVRTAASETEMPIGLPTSAEAMPAEDLALFAAPATASGGAGVKDYSEEGLSPEVLGPFTVEDAKRARNCMNLDCIPKEELKWFAYHFIGDGNSPVVAARILFPERRTGSQPDPVSVTHQLHVYASLKSMAMEDRLEGRIEFALEREKDCERIYKNLPSYAKW